MPYYGPGTDDISFEMLSAKEERTLFKRAYKDDLAARDELIARHLKFVAKLAIACSRGMLVEEDAISAGNYALMMVLSRKRFNPNKGIRFSSYLRYYIRGEVLYAMFHPTQRLLSSDSYEDPDKALAEIPDPGEAIDKTCEGRQLNEARHSKIESALASLGDLERAAVVGVGMYQKKHSQIARETGKSRQASHQAYERGLKKLRRIFSCENCNELKP